MSRKPGWGRPKDVGCKQKFLLQRHGEGGEQKARSESWKCDTVKQEETSAVTGGVGGQLTVC